MHGTRSVGPWTTVAAKIANWNHVGLTHPFLPTSISTRQPEAIEGDSPDIRTIDARCRRIAIRPPEQDPHHRRFAGPWWNRPHLRAIFTAMLRWGARGSR